MGIRSASGVSCLEIAITAVLLLVVCAIGLDSTLIILAMMQNDLACRDATRAGARQSTPDKALQAAQAQLKIHTADGYWISQPALTSQSAPDFIFNDFGNNPPPQTSPYITVTTSTVIKCPVPIFFFGADFMHDGSITYRRSYTFPIIKVKLYE